MKMKMIDKEKTKLIQFGLVLADIEVNEKQSEIIWRICETVSKKGNKFSVEDAVKIKWKVLKEENKIETINNWDSHLKK